MLFPPPNQGPLCPVFTLFSLTDSHAIDSNLTPFPLDSSWQFGDDCVTERVLSARLQQVNGAIVVFVHLSWITGKIRWNMIQVRLQIQRSLPYSGSLFHLISNLMSHASSQRMRKRLSTTWGQNSTQTFGFLTVLKTKFTKWTNFITEPPKDQHQQGLHSKLQTLAGPKHHSLKKTESYNLSLQNEKQGGNTAIFMLNILIHHHILWKLAISYHNISDLSQSCQILLCLVNHLYPDWSYLIVSYLTVSHHTFSSLIDVSPQGTWCASKARILISFLEGRFYSFDLGNWQCMLQYLQVRCGYTFYKFLHVCTPKPKTRPVCNMSKKTKNMFVCFWSYSIKTHAHTHKHSKHIHILHKVYMTSVYIHMMQASPTCLW